MTSDPAFREAARRAVAKAPPMSETARRRLFAVAAEYRAERPVEKVDERRAA